MASKKERNLKSLCAKYGATLGKQGRGGHYKIKFNGKTVSSAPATPSDRRALLNLECDLRRAVRG